MRWGRAGGQRGRSGGAAWRGWVMEVHGDSEYRVRGARHDGVRAAIGTLPRARAGARKKAGGMRLGRASGQRGRKQKPPKTQIVKSVATGRHGFFMPRNENNHSFRELRYVKESKTFAVFGNIVHIRGKRLSQISNMQNSVHFLYNPKRTSCVCGRGVCGAPALPVAVLVAAVVGRVRRQDDLECCEHQDSRSHLRGDRP